MPADEVKAVLEQAAVGLRERKKQETRQHISDTATVMFMKDGFDAVKISEIAKAAGVSEKTVYNYFPTKESLLLDQEELQAERLRTTLGDPHYASPIDAMLAILQDDIENDDDWMSVSKEQGLAMFRRFTELLGETPSLRAAWLDMFNRLTEAAAEALSERYGLPPAAPEVRIAAHSLIGLYHVQQDAMARHAGEGGSIKRAVKQAQEETMRAASMLSIGLAGPDPQSRRSRPSREEKRELRDGLDDLKQQQKRLITEFKARMKERRTR